MQMKYDKQWHLNLGFKYIRMNRRLNQIEQFIKILGKEGYWSPIDPIFPTYKSMYDHFQALLADDHTLQDDEKTV
jgi:hypothetical protein